MGSALSQTQLPQSRGAYQSVGSGSGFNQDDDFNEVKDNAAYWESEIEDEDPDDFVYVNAARNLLGLLTHVREQVGDDIQDIVEQERNQDSGSGCQNGDEEAPEVARVPSLEAQA